MAFSAANQFIILVWDWISKNRYFIYKRKELTTIGSFFMKMVQYFALRKRTLQIFFIKKIALQSDAVDDLTNLFNFFISNGKWRNNSQTFRRK